MSSGRPRLNVDRRAEPSGPAVNPDAIAATIAESPAAAVVWSRPTVAVPVIDSSVEAEIESGGAAEYRRSPARKTNRTVSVSADVATAARARAVDQRWSITDVVFLAVERYRERLRAAPELPGRALGQRGSMVARAHLVLYLADEEWDGWKDAAHVSGLGTPSRLVDDALAALAPRPPIR